MLLTSVPFTRRTASAAFALALASVACTERQAPTTHTVRDSSGITIIENQDVAGWAAGREWLIEATPAVDIGADDSDPMQLLDGVIHATRLRDGRIAVVSYRSDDVRIFSADGSYTQTVGRSGQGPGEFGEPWWVTETAGDSLLVLDIGRGFTFNLFTPDGQFVRRYGTEVTHGIEGTELVGMFGDATLLVLRHGDGPATAANAEGVQRSLTSFFRIGANGEKLDSLGQFVNQSSRNSRRLIWGPWGHADAGADGFYFGAADSFEIEQRSMDGTLQRLIRLDRSGQQMSDADIAQYKEERLRAAEASGDANRVRTIRAIDEVSVFATHLPPYFYVKVDGAGNLWVQEYATTIATGRSWSVFDTAGVFLGDVSMPERFRVLEIGADFVLGVWLDEFDVQHVRMHRIVKPKG